MCVLFKGTSKGLLRQIFFRVIQREHQNLYLEKIFYWCRRDQETQRLLNPTLKWRILRWLLLMRTTISLKQNDLNLSSHVDLLILKFLTLVDSNVKLYITSAKTLHDTTLYSQIFSGLVLTFLMLCTSLVSLCLPHALFT